MDKTWALIGMQRIAAVRYLKARRLYCALIAGYLMLAFATLACQQVHLPNHDENVKAILGGVAVEAGDLSGCDLAVVAPL